MEWTSAGQAKLEVAKSHHTDANDAAYKRQWAKSLRKLNEALSLRRQVLPADHPVVIATMQCMADVMCRSGELRRARVLLRDIASLQKDRYGPNHTEVEATLELLCKVLSELGEYEEYEIVGKQIWELRGRVANSTAAEADGTNIHMQALEDMLEKWQIPKKLQTRVEIARLQRPEAHMAVSAPARTSVFDSDGWMEELQRQLQASTEKLAQKVRALKSKDYSVLGQSSSEPIVGVKHLLEREPAPPAADEGSPRSPVSPSSANPPETRDGGEGADEFTEVGQFGSDSPPRKGSGDRSGGAGGDEESDPDTDKEDAPPIAHGDSQQSLPVVSEDSSRRTSVSAQSPSDGSPYKGSSPSRGQGW